MTPAPTGRIRRLSRDNYDLTLTRTFDAPLDDVWASLTDPERTAGWFGPWRGEPATGRDIEVQMAFEDTAPWMGMRIDACESPTRLALSATDEYGDWILELTLTEANGATALEFAQHRIDTSAVGSIGPGWEWYLDMLVASREGRPLPSFDDYYPAQKDYFERNAAVARVDG